MSLSLDELQTLVYHIEFGKDKKRKQTRIEAVQTHEEDPFNVLLRQVSSLHSCDDDISEQTERAAWSLLCYYSGRLDCLTVLSFLRISNCAVRMSTMSLLKRMTKISLSLDELLREIYKTTNKDIRNEAIKLALRFYRISPYHLLSFFISDDEEVRKTVEERIGNLRGEEIDFRGVYHLIFSGNSCVANASLRLTLKHLGGDLKFDTLMTIFRRGDRRTREMAAPILLERFPERLPYQMLLRFLRIGDKNVRDRARELLNRIPAKEFIREELLKFANFTNQGSFEVQQVAKELLQKI